MNYDEYSKFVDSCIKPGQEIKDSLTPEQCHLLHMAVGISGEAGELLDAIKKHTIYQKPLDRENVIEELGDLIFYMQGIINVLDLEGDEIIERNVAKLQKRYAHGYSDQAAQDRADKQ
jgi:NTP pyrophosphatase (non-canonical NTP hydrolase)